MQRALRANLDPIEAAIARLERRVSLAFWLIALWCPLVGILAFAAGSYLGGRVPGTFVTLDLNGRPMGVVVPVQVVPDVDLKGLSKLPEKEFKLSLPSATRSPPERARGDEPAATQGGKK